jgi:hypothetical protein
MFLVRFLYIQFYQIFTKAIIVSFKFISKFTIIDLQILALIVIIHLIFKCMRKQIFNLKRKIFYQ